MKTWKITYKTKDGFIGEVEVNAVNRVMAYEVFDSMGFENVIDANARLVSW